MGEKTPKQTYFQGRQPLCEACHRAPAMPDDRLCLLCDMDEQDQAYFDCEMED